jgi:hypothetical protein
MYTEKIKQIIRFVLSTIRKPFQDSFFLGFFMNFKIPVNHISYNKHKRTTVTITGSLRLLVNY